MRPLLAAVVMFVVASGSESEAATHLPTLSCHHMFMCREYWGLHIHFLQVPILAKVKLKQSRKAQDQWEDSTPPKRKKVSDLSQASAAN